MISEAPTPIRTPPANSVAASSLVFMIAIPC
jgi:hypothetical protein